MSACLLVCLSVCSSVELLPLLGKRSNHYTAIIIEEPDSYVGREVRLQPLTLTNQRVEPMKTEISCSLSCSLYLLPVVLFYCHFINHLSDD